MKNFMHLIKKILKFRDDRNWKSGHTPSNLAKSISIEAAELLELFQWSDSFDKEKLADELADVLIYSFTLADTVGLDIEEIVLSKIKKNAKVLVANTPMDYDKIKIYGSRVKVDSMDKVADIENAEKDKMRKKVDELKKIKTTNGIIKPEKIAETYLHLVNQHPSALTFEMDIRSQNELAWWNNKSRNV